MKRNFARIHLDNSLKVLLNKLKNKKGKLLNIGCGTQNRYMELFKNFTVDGVDLLQNLNKDIPYTHHVCDASKLPFNDHNFDAIIALEAFEHIDDNVNAMKESFRVLKKNSHAIFSTPTNYTWIFEFGRHGPHYYSKKKLIDLIESNGYKIEEFHKIGGVVFFFTNLLKSWISIFGYKIFGNKFWNFIDCFFLPFYLTSMLTDRFFNFLPTNYLVLASKR